MLDSVVSESAAPTQKVTIRLVGHDLKPPVYIAGSFTSEPWEAEEMHLTTEQSEHGETMFKKTFLIHPGEHHYKFRLGDGEWWICDERSPIVKDEAGNSNNLLVVSPMNHKPSLSPTHLPTMSLPVEAAETPLATSEVPKIFNKDDQKNTDVPVGDHEGFLGTWEPHREQSPMHRRASTNLGVRISRMGTFLPPEITPDSTKDADMEFFPTDQKSILARMETLKKELPEDDSSYLAETLHTDASNIPKTNTHDQPASLANHKAENISNIDGSMETSLMLPGISTAAKGFQPIDSKTLDFGRSYGTIAAETTNNMTKSQQLSVESTTLRNNSKASAAQPAVPQSTVSNGEIKHRRIGQEVSRDSVAEEKSELTDEEERSRSILFLTVLTTIAAWFRNIWDWMFGTQKPKQNETTNDH